MDPCACCDDTTGSCTCWDEDWCATCYQCLVHCPCLVVPEGSTEPPRHTRLQAVYGRYTTRDRRSRQGVTVPETLVSVRLPPYLRQQLELWQRRTGLTRSEVIRWAIEQVIREGHV